MNISNLEADGIENQIHWTLNRDTGFGWILVKIWFQNRRMKWRNSKERELLASGGSREQTLPNKNNPHPDLSDAEADKQKLSPLSPINDEQGEEKAKIYPTTSEFRGYDDKMAAGPLFTREFSNMEDGEDYDSDPSASDEEINVT